MSTRASGTVPAVSPDADCARQSRPSAKRRHSLEQCLEVGRRAAAASRAHRAADHRRRWRAVQFEHEVLANRRAPTHTSPSACALELEETHFGVAG